MSLCGTTKSEKGNRLDVQTERCRQSAAGKKNLKGMKLESLEVDSPIFINDSLCSYYKHLWSKCKRLWTKKYIHTFWVSNGSVKIKIRENSKPKTISHTTDLEKVFPDNELLKDEEFESNQ